MCMFTVIIALRLLALRKLSPPYRPRSQHVRALSIPTSDANSLVTKDATISSSLSVRFFYS